MRILSIAESTYYAWQKPAKLADEHCESSGCKTGRPKTTFSSTSNGKKISNEQIKEWLSELVSGEESAYGYKKLNKCLQLQHGLLINKKKTYCLCKELKILKPQRKIVNKYPRKLARNRTITSINQLWEIDIKYGYIAGEDRFFYFMGVIDVYDRVIIDYHIGLTCEGRHAAEILSRALWKRKLLNAEQKPVIRSDNGPQFISGKFQKACEKLSIEHERIPPKTPNLNAHIESFHSILERDCYSQNEFASYTDAYATVTQFLDFYVNRYLHGSLDYLPPAEFHDKVVKDGYQPFNICA